MNQLATLFMVASGSLRHRLSGVLLTIVSVALSVFVLLGVEHVRQETRKNFASTVTGVELIVGARTGDINLLLLSIFRIGSATANVSWSTVEVLSDHDRVDWVVPISLGDSHRGFRVVGTTTDFFERYQYGRSEGLTFSKGARFEKLDDVVIGASVASSLNYSPGDSVTLSHGIAETSFSHHEELPLTVVGVLKPTGTPIDNALFVSLEAIDAVHSDAEHNEGHGEGHGHDEASKGPDEADFEDDDHDGAHHGTDAHHDDHDEHYESDSHGADHKNERYEEVHEEAGHRNEHKDYAYVGPLDSVTALLVGLNGPVATLQVQRWVNEYEEEALLAILPGVALSQLWDLVGGVEAALRAIALVVFISSLFGLNAMLMASMRERRQEIIILRSIGAPSVFIVTLLIVEALLIVTIGVLLAIACLLLAIAGVNGVLTTVVGLSFSYQILYTSSLIALGLIYLTTLVLGLIPAWQAYQLSQSSSPTE
ncbi:MAG: ABC transporter permease [Pirellulales bacterium]|nr:ABC transporter permease [Pirellulales bacterium]